MSNYDVRTHSMYAKPSPAVITLDAIMSAQENSARCQQERICPLHPIFRAIERRAQSDMSINLEQDIRLFVLTSTLCPDIWSGNI